MGVESGRFPVGAGRGGIVVLAVLAWAVPCLEAQEGPLDAFVKSLAAKQKAPSTAPAELRRVIDHEHPLLLIQLYPHWRDAEEDLLRFWNALGDELQPHSALFFRRTPTHPPERYFKALLAAARKHGIPIVTLASRYPRGAEDQAMERNECLLGLNPYEYAYRWDLGGVAAICRRRGGYVFWPCLDNYDRFIEGQAPQFHVPGYERMYDFFRDHGRNIVLQVKCNGTRQLDKKYDRQALGEFIHASEITAGAWLTGLLGAWGHQPEDWLWYEKGYTRLFEYSEPTDRGRFGIDLHGIINHVYPENLLAQEVLLAMIHGCAMVSFEIGLVRGSQTEPWFDKAMGPMLREVVRRRLIPSRQEMLRRTRAATDGSCARLYANTACAMQNDGRYGLIPWLPSGTPLSERRRFELLPGDYDFRVLPLLNALYPREGRGRSFIERHGAIWYVMNPWENVNKDTDFHLPLYVNTCTELSGRLGPHTFAIVEEAPDRIDIYLSNYREVKDEIWPRRHDILSRKVDMWKILAAARAGANRALRTTSVVLTGHDADQPPALTVDGHDGCRSEHRWQKRERRFELDVHHNGVVRVVLKATGREQGKQPPQGLSANLCIGKPAQAGSAREGCPPAGAVDGSYDTFWAPKGAGAPWIMVDLGRPMALTAYKLVHGAGPAAGAITWRLELASDAAGAWTTVHRGAGTGQRLRAYALDAPGRYRYARLVFDPPAEGCAVRELGLYTGPAEALKAWAPLAEPEDLSAIVALLGRAGSDAERAAVGEAVLAAWGKPPDKGRSLDLLVRTFRESDELHAAEMVRVLGRVRGPKALQTVRGAAADERREVREAAQWALAEWPHADTLNDKLQLARSAADLSLRARALRSMLKVVEATPELRPAQRRPLLIEGLALAAEQQTKLLYLEAMASATDPAVFEALARRMYDPDSRQAARRARELCVAMVPRVHPAEIKRVLTALLAQHKDDAGFRQSVLESFPDLAH